MKKLMPKILFINPPGDFEAPVLPLGLASIIAYLKSKDKSIDISVLDAWAEKIGFEELKNKVFKTKADIIGVFMVSPRYDQAKKTIETCREILPNSLIIAGGPHPSAIPVETLKDIPQLDICCIGEGEITMRELVSGCQVPAINGIAYRNGEEIKLTPPREFIKNLDELPWPARDFFPLEKYKAQPPLGRKKPYFSIITSRGCPFQCAFCSKAVFKNNYRTRSPQNVCNEIEYLIKRCGAKEIQFYDDDFSLNMKRAEEICDEIIRRNLKFRWACATRVDQVNENLLKKMKKAGCCSLMYGLESGSQKILDSIDKRFTVEQVISAFEMAKKAGLSTFCSFIVGLPGETKETLKETFDLVEKIKPSFLAGGPLRIYPGSHIFELIRAGKCPGKLRILKKGEGVIAAFFNMGNYAVLEDNFTFEEMKKITKKALHKFYLRPQYIFQSLMAIRSFSDFKY